MGLKQLQRAKMGLNWHKYVSWNLLKMEADYPKQCTLWKETNFKNRIDTILGGQYIQNEEFILVVELSGNHLLKMGYGYGSG